MKRKLLEALCAVVALVCAAVQAVPTPPPMAENGKIPKDAAERLKPGEVSLAMDVCFDALPFKGSATALIGVAAEADGTVSVTLPAAPTSLLGDLVVKSRDKVKKGETHQVIVTVSLMRTRVAFYLDGALQFENDNVNLPEIAWGEPKPATDFGGKVLDFRVWDIALDSERMAHSDVRGKTVWDVCNEKNVAALKARIDKETKSAKNPVVTDDFVAFSTDPMSDVPVLPDAIPEVADFNGVVDVMAAQGEYEAASVVVMARRPVKSMTLRLGDLKCGNATIPSKDVDIRIVKRWYRTGGAWASYFCDYRARILTPHLLVYDDDLVRTDEIRTRNYYRLNYPEGVLYADISDPKKGNQSFSGHIPFEDAKTLQPVKSLDAFGRNVQYWLLFKGPKTPGLYTGTLEFVQDGKTAAKMDVRFRVLPFELPLYATSYDNPSRKYISHLNFQCEIAEGLTYEERRASALAILKSCFAHNVYDIAGIWNKSGEYTELVREAGIPDGIIFANRCAPAAWQGFYKDKKPDELTAADREAGMRRAERLKRATYEFFNREHPDSEKWTITYSESGAYRVLNVQNQDQCRILHKWGWNVFTHGGDENWYVSGDFQDGNIGALDRRTAELWHAVGGMLANYARPFDAPENPAIHRRMRGLNRWKELRQDGDMMHGLIDHDTGINQFAPDPGGDGNYRCQMFLYRQRAGIIETICWEGVREAFDDIKYLTLLRGMALEHRDSDNEPLRREARRALGWIERIDGAAGDMNAVRSGCVERIMILRDLVAMKGGK